MAMSPSDMGKTPCGMTRRGAEFASGERPDQVVGIRSASLLNEDNEMKLFARIAALTLAVAGLVAAAPAASAQTAFPMKVGNEWSYQETGFAAAPDLKVVKIDDRWVSPASGYVYFRFRNFNGNYHWLTRAPGTGWVGEYATGWWYNFDARINASWKLTLDESGTHGSLPCSNGALLQVVSRSETVTVPAGRFSAIHFQWRTTCFDAGITDEWFAPGVGLVKRSSQTIGGPRSWELVTAKIDGRTIGGQPASARILSSVAMGQADYWENHMPGPGPRPTEGPEIKISVTLKPADGRDTSINTPDLNIWDVTVYDAAGNAVWSNPKSRAVARPQGYDHPVAGAGWTVDHTFRFPYGTAQGTYTVKAKCLATKPQTFTEVRTSFTYGWAF